MIKCKQCGKEMSEYLSSCPNCGWKIGTEPILTQDVHQKNSFSVKEKKGLVVSSIILCFGLITLYIGVSMRLLISAIIRGNAFIYFLHSLFFYDNDMSKVFRVICVGAITTIFAIVVFFTILIKNRKTDA